MISNLGLNIKKTVCMPKGNKLVPAGPRVKLTGKLREEVGVDVGNVSVPTARRPWGGRKAATYLAEQEALRQWLRRGEGDSVPELLILEASTPHRSRRGAQASS